MSSGTKSIRLNFLVDPDFKKMLDLGAHESWMPVGQYIRDIIELFNGSSYDAAADLVTIGSEVTLDGLESLRECAARRKMSVKDFCLSLSKPRQRTEGEAGQEAGQPVEHPMEEQIDLFSRGATE